MVSHKNQHVIGTSKWDTNHPFIPVICHYNVTGMQNNVAFNASFVISEALYVVTDVAMCNIVEVIMYIIYCFQGMTQMIQGTVSEQGSRRDMSPDHSLNTVW